MVSAAAKKRQQKKKNLRKNQNIQTSKSTTDLNQFLNDDASHIDEVSKELGDQELEDLLNDELDAEEPQNFHVKQKSGSNYTFFNDTDAKTDANDLDDDFFGDDIDLLLSDEELDLDVAEDVPESQEQQLDLEEATKDEVVSQDIPELIITDGTRDFSNISQKGTEDKLEKYATRILADEVLDSNSFVPEIDNALEQLQDEQEMIPELQQHVENVDIQEISFVQDALHEDDVLLNDELNAEEQNQVTEAVNEIEDFNKDKIASDEVPDIIQNRDTQNEALNSQTPIEEVVIPPQENINEEEINETEKYQADNGSQHFDETSAPAQTEAAESIEESTAADIANEVEQIPETAVVTAEYIAEESQIPLVESEKNFDVNVKHTQAELDHVPEAAASVENASSEIVDGNFDEQHDPSVTNAPEIIETEFSAEKDLTDEDFFNNLSVENAQGNDSLCKGQDQIENDKDSLLEDQDQKENDLSFFDQLSSQVTENPIHGDPKDAAVVNSESIVEPLDDAEFFNNLVQPVKTTQVSEHLNEDSLLKEDDNDSILLSEQEDDKEENKDELILPSENKEEIFILQSEQEHENKVDSILPTEKEQDQEENEDNSILLSDNEDEESILISEQEQEDKVNSILQDENEKSTLPSEQKQENEIDNILPNEDEQDQEENEDDSILLSEIDEDHSAPNDLNKKKDYTNVTVVQTPLDNAYSEELIEDLIDSDLLDDDSLLDSDEELDLSEEQIQPVNEEKEYPKKINKYAPTAEVSKPSNSAIEPSIIKNTNASVQPVLNIIKPQIIAPSTSTNENQKPPVVTKYRTEKHKTDAYDFPVDLVSNLKPPSKAKAIKTANVPKSSFTNVPVPSDTAPQNVAAPQINVPSIPVNPYASSTASKSTIKKNPYAPQAMNVPSPSLSVHSSNSGIVKPPLNIVSVPPIPNIPSQPHTHTAPFAANPPVNNPRAPIPVSNTDLPFDIAPPKAVPRTKPQVQELPKNPPINNNRARAVSNVSASSLSAGIYSPSMQNPNAGAFDSANGNFPAAGFTNQRLPSRSGSMNKPNPILGDNKPKNMYAPSFQHIRKNSNASFSPVNHPMGLQNSNISQTGTPGMNALKTVGLNNANNPLSPITPGSKVSHARSHSSVYAPKKNQGAASKYAPTVHPSVQQAFSQQQNQPPINGIPNEFAVVNPGIQNGHSRTGSYIPPINNGFAPSNNMPVPQNSMLPNQQVANQPQFGFPNNTNNQFMLNNAHSAGNTFVPNSNTIYQQQPPIVNAQQFSQYPINTLPIENQTSTKPLNALPISNPEELNAKQFPIVHWSASGHVVSLKVSRYQNTANIKIQPQESVVLLPKHFLDFPGILVRGKAKPKTLQPWLDETCQFLNGDSAYDADGKVLWNLLNRKIALMEEKVGDISSFSNYASVLYDQTELDKFIENNKNNGFNHNQFQQQSMAASKLDGEGLAQVLTYLRVGKHSEALSIALKSDDFSMSMVIASLIGKEKWTEVVDLYLKKEFQGSGPDSEFAVNLLSSIFQVYIGNGKSLIDDFKSNELKKNWALNNWNIILASVLSNSKSGTDVNSTNNMLVGFLVDMGIFLSENGKSLASDCCFILADVPLSFNEIIPGSNVTFSEVGAANSLDGMLLSDLYEYCHKSSLPKFSGFLTLIGSKISHAEVLLLQKQYTTANKILDVCTHMNKEMMKTGNAQLKYVYTIDKLRTIIDSKSDSWIGKPTLSGVWGTLDKSFNKLIGGDNIDEATDDVNNGITKSESKLFDTFDAANSNNISAAEANRSYNFSQGFINNRAPHLHGNNNLASTQSESNLYNENSNVYQNNKNMLTKNAVSNIKQESINNTPPVPPSLSSVASSEHFNQQVANNLAKLHSHSRNQSVDSLLSFAPSNQRLTANNNTKRSAAVSHALPGNSRSNDYNTPDTVVKKPMKKYGGDVDSFTADKPPHFSLSTASNKYSPAKQSEKSDETKQSVYNDIQKAIVADHDTDMFLNKNQENDVSVNSPPKNVTPFENRENVKSSNDYTFPKEMTFTPMQSQNPSQLTIQQPIKSTENLPAKRKESDFSPHESVALPRSVASFENRSGLESNNFSDNSGLPSDLPIPGIANEETRENSEFALPPRVHTAHSSLASPVKTEVLQKDQENQESRILDTHFDPPNKPFNSQYMNNVKNQNYVPVTPQQQQFNRGYQSNGWVKTHSRSSSQILAEMTGLNSNNVNNFQNTNTGIGGSVYTSRNVSIDSNIASSEPVIRQIRSSSVVFTPDSKRRQSEKVMYDDIVEEDEENDKQSSQKEAMLIEKKLAAAREKAEIERQRKESEAKKQKDTETKGKNDKKAQENGWFGWLKANNNPNEKKAIKAKLGQKNQFYYDEKLKRWVNKNATEEEKKEIEAEANSAPPPPPVIKKKSVMPETKPRSGSVLGGPTQRTFGVMPPKNPITGESLIPETEPDRASFNNGNFGSIVVQTVAEETASEVNSDSKPKSSEPLSALGTGRIPSNVSNVNLTSSATGLDDLLSLGTPGPMTGGPPSNFGSRIGTPGTTASRRNKKANRGYVNVMDHM